MNDVKPVKINETTLIPFSLLGAILATVAGAAWWASAFYVKFAQAEVRITSLETNQHEVIKQLQQTNDTLIEIKTVLKQDRKFR